MKIKVVVIRNFSSFNGFLFSTESLCVRTFEMKFILFYFVILQKKKKNKLLSKNWNLKILIFEVYCVTWL